MILTFLYQGYMQQPSSTQENVFENVLCDVFEMKAFGSTFLKFKPVQNELLDSTDSDSTGVTDTTDSEQV